MGWALVFAKLAWWSWFPKKREEPRHHSIPPGRDKNNAELEAELKRLEVVVVKMMHAANDLHKRNKELETQVRILKSSRIERLFVGNDVVTHFKDYDGTN